MSLLLAGCETGNGTELNVSTKINGASSNIPSSVNSINTSKKVDFEFKLPVSFTGFASWYKSGFMTASGERFNTNDLTIAHKTLPFGTRVKLTNLKNNKTVIARVDDRGPFVPGRILDTSRQVALLLGFLPQGTAKLRVDVLK